MQYSTNGINWSPASMALLGATWPHTTTSNVVYGGSIPGWLAAGFNSNTMVPSLMHSTNGTSWSAVPLVFTPFQAVGPIQFDGTYWCVFVAYGNAFTLWQHDALSSTMLTASSWKSTPKTFPSSSLSPAATTALYTFPTPLYSTAVASPVLYVGGVTPNGPTFTSPTTTGYSTFQYVSITPIVVTASDPTSILFLASTLPPGMNWNAATSTLSGLSVELGSYTVVIYAQTARGASALTLTFTVTQLVIKPTLLTASAATSLTREKVIADSATSAVNDHVTPFEVGPFLLERPPVVTTAPEICCDPVKNIIS
jgi:hypothetical protein